MLGMRGKRRPRSRIMLAEHLKAPGQSYRVLYLLSGAHFALAPVGAPAKQTVMSSHALPDYFAL
eukprot:scaffold134281_cov32-Tisochrysis_lutea.AAC.6